MSEESSRVINLDEEGVVRFTLGGRPFEVRQQRRSILEKVLRAIYARETDPVDKLPEQAEDNMQFLEGCFANWRDRTATFALILGFEEDSPERAAILEHLEEHLTFPRAKWVFQEWWRLNELVDFFGLGGNPMVPQFASSPGAGDAADSPMTQTSS